MSYITFERNKYRLSHMGKLEMKLECWFAPSRATSGYYTSVLRSCFGQAQHTVLSRVRCEICRSLKLRLDYSSHHHYRFYPRSIFGTFLMNSNEEYSNLGYVNLVLFQHSLFDNLLVLMYLKGKFNIFLHEKTKQYYSVL